MTETKTQVRKNILVYLIFTIILCTPVYLAIAHTGNLASGAPGVSYTMMIMWCPAIATFLTCRVLNIKLSTLGWKWAPRKLLWWSYLVPFLYALTAYLIIWISGKGGFYNKENLDKITKGLGWDGLPDGLVIFFYAILLGAFGIIRSVSSALGEEIGWRGFLTPQLAKLNSYTVTSLLMGVVWSLYHYPLMIFANYNNGAPAWYSLTCFTVMIFASCFVFTWFRLKSGSLWTGVLLHASHNLFVQVLFTPLTVDNGNTKYYIDEFGAILPAVTVIAAVICWLKRKELPIFAAS